VIAGHIELAFRRVLSGPGVSLDPRFVRLATGTAHPFGNFACMSHPADETSTSVAIDPLIRRNAPSAVLYVGAVPDAIGQQMTAAGFTRAGGMPAMAVDIAEALTQTSLPDGYSFARVTAAADRDTWADVFARGYGVPPLVGAAFAGGIDGEESATAAVQYFWILNNDQPVCTSLVFLEQGVAGVYCVATLPEERKKGLGAHATAQPLRIAHQLGYRVGVLQSSAEGHSVYRRIGFTDFGEVPLFVRMPIESRYAGNE
jgi:GNAT superfamily N-acetyltransferase